MSLAHESSRSELGLIVPPVWPLTFCGRIGGGGGGGGEYGVKNMSRTSLKGQFNMMDL